MKELIEYIARAIVDNPDAVKITEEPGENGGVVFKLEVAQEDKGKVIGKQGQTARAIRTLLRIAAVQRDMRASLEIV